MRPALLLLAGIVSVACSRSAPAALEAQYCDNSASTAIVVVRAPLPRLSWPGGCRADAVQIDGSDPVESGTFGVWRSPVVPAGVALPIEMTPTTPGPFTTPDGLLRPGPIYRVCRIRANGDEIALLPGCTYFSLSE